MRAALGGDSIPGSDILSGVKPHEETYHELCAYTLAHGDASFIHQLVVDAWAVQTAEEASKPIGVAFSLAGLYLHVERGLTGRDVQRAHMKMAREKREWPRFQLPAHRGALTAADVMRAPAGPERDAAIHAWCASVWDACRGTRDAVISLLERHGIR